ncbi:putative Rz protein [Morganella phage Mecenats66]|nr:putative Rz protein [Morganella phage Mecenats66]
MTDINVQLALVSRDIEQVKKDLAEVQGAMVTKAEFTPVKNIVYGVVGLLLTAILSQIVSLVMK